MSKIELQARDGHTFSAYRAEPSGTARGAVVILHEILGVTPYIERVCDRFAAEGYVATAPFLFDRFERNVSLGMEPADIARGRELRDKVGFDLPLTDISAAIADSRRYGPVAIIGFCWGGTLAWRAADIEGVSAAVCYYGGQIVDFLDEPPTVPVLLHFGEKDPMIPIEARAAILAAYPDVSSHLYSGGHAFDNDMREDHDPESSKLAHARTLAFLKAILGS